MRTTAPRLSAAERRVATRRDAGVREAVATKSPLAETLDKLAPSATATDPIDASTAAASTTADFSTRVARDGPRMAAVAGLMALVGEGAYTYLSTQPQLPPVSEVLGALAAASALLPAGLLLAKAVLRDRFHAELYRGRLYICAGVPSTGPPLAPGSVVVRPTGDVRGNGAYAAACIPAGTHLGDYSGDMLDKSAFDRRYPDGVGDFSMAVNDEWIVDAAHLAPDTAAFHPVHMNHSRVRPNVGRFYARSERRVAFFTLSDVEPGTELLYDYGRAYWQGREHMELP